MLLDTGKLLCSDWDSADGPLSADECQMWSMSPLISPKQAEQARQISNLLAGLQKELTV